MTTLIELLGAANNLNDPKPWLNYKDAIYGVTITGLIITTVCVAARLYVRYFVTRSPGWDDYFVIATYLTGIVATAGGLHLTDKGLGEHFILLGLDGMANFTKTFYWANAIYNMALTLIKLSLLTQYLRMLDERPDIPHLKLRNAIRLLIAVVALWGLAWSIVAWVPCWPIQADWDFTDSSATRWGYGTRNAAVFVGTFYAHAASNMVLDVAVLLVPCLSRGIWDAVASNRKSRAGLLALFALGGLSVICSIVRLINVIEHKSTTYPTFDPTWYGTPTIVLSLLEIDLATVVAALPVFWPHLRRNMTLIMVTHEVEVKVTRQSAFFGGGGKGEDVGTVVTTGHLPPAPRPSAAWEKEEEVERESDEKNRIRTTQHVVRVPPRQLLNSGRVRLMNLNSGRVIDPRPGSSATSRSDDSSLFMV